MPRSRYDELGEEAFALASRKAALEATHDGEALARHEEYQRLLSRLERVEPALQEAIETLVVDGFGDAAVCLHPGR